MILVLFFSIQECKLSLWPAREELGASRLNISERVLQRLGEEGLLMAACSEATPHL